MGVSSSHLYHLDQILLRIEKYIELFQHLKNANINNYIQEDIFIIKFSNEKIV